MRGTRVWLLIGVIALLVSAFAVAGCGGDDDDDGGDTTTAASGEDLGLITEGTLFVGLDTPYPPFAEGQPPNVTRLRHRGDERDRREHRPGGGVPGHRLPDDLPRCGGRPVRHRRRGVDDHPGSENAVDFTDPYYELERTAGARGLGHRLGRRPLRHDRRHPGRDHQETFANDETDASEVRGFPEGPNAVSALVTGQVDAVIIDQPVAVDAVEKQGGVEIVQEIPANELYGFAVAPDNDALREAMNEALATIKEDGTMADLYETVLPGEPPPSARGREPAAHQRLARRPTTDREEGADGALFVSGIA